MTKIALMTGGNQGLGLALVKALANRLAPQDVVYLAFRSLQRGQEAADSLGKTQAQVQAIQLDVTAPDSIAALAAHLNAVHVLVSLLAALVAFLAALGIYTIIEFRLRDLDPTNDWIAGGMVALIWILVGLLTVLVVTHRARKRLQGTLGILEYMAIRAREGELASAQE